MLMPRTKEYFHMVGVQPISTLRAYTPIRKPFSRVSRLASFKRRIETLRHRCALFFFFVDGLIHFISVLRFIHISTGCRESPNRIYNHPRPCTDGIASPDVIVSEARRTGIFHGGLPQIGNPAVLPRTSRITLR